MYYDQNGNPDPNGNCQMMDGKLVLRPGHAVRFAVDLMDSAPRNAHFFTDNQRSVADNAKAVAMIRDARYSGFPGIVGSEDHPRGISQQRSAPLTDAASVVAAIRAARYA